MRHIRMLVVVAGIAAATWGGGAALASSGLSPERDAWWSHMQALHALARDATVAPPERVARLVQSLSDELSSPTPLTERHSTIWTFHEISLQHLTDALQEVGDAEVLRGLAKASDVPPGARDWVWIALGQAGIADIGEGDGAVLTEVLRIASASPDMNLRYKATDVLRRRTLPDDDRVVPALEALLEDPGFRQDPTWRRPEVVTAYKVVMVSPTEVRAEAIQIDLSKDARYSWGRQYSYPVRGIAAVGLEKRGVKVCYDPENPNTIKVVEAAPSE